MQHFPHRSAITVLQYVIVTFQENCVASCLDTLTGSLRAVYWYSEDSPKNCPLPPPLRGTCSGWRDLAGRQGSIGIWSRFRMGHSTQCHAKCFCLNRCVCESVHIYVCTCICMYMCVYIHACVHMSVSFYMCVCFTNTVVVLSKEYRNMGHIRV